MSPFTDAADHVTDRLRLLGVRHQVAFFIAAARALEPGYRAWRQQAGPGGVEESEIFEAALRRATEFAISGSAPPPDLLNRFAACTPSEPTEDPFLTAAQDCWICLDTAIQLRPVTTTQQTLHGILLEPMFQATSERLFGYTDVGSSNQESAESTALKDPQLRRALDRVSEAISTAAGSPTEALIANLRAVLTPIGPV